MDRRWLVRGLLALGAVGLAVAGVVTYLRRRGTTLGPDGVVDSDTSRRAGSPADRGKVPAIGIDVDGLRDVESFEPAVEYLTYIQSKRGTTEHLLFVRHEDLDAIAALEGQDLETFLERLQHLGVVISTN